MASLASVSPLALWRRLAWLEVIMAEILNHDSFTEEWINEKATELYNYLYYETFSLEQVRDFIRLLIKKLEK